MAAWAASAPAAFAAATAAAPRAPTTGAPLQGAAALTLAVVPRPITPYPVLLPRATALLTDPGAPCAPTFGGGDLLPLAVLLEDTTTPIYGVAINATVWAWARGV